MLQPLRRLAGPAVAIALCAWAGPAAAEDPVERGRYLVETIAACGNCHTPKGPSGEIEGMTLAGGFVIEEEPFTAVAPNITPDPQTGIGAWSDEEIVDAIREGRRPDGTIIGPPMAFGFYRDISDSDARAIVAYLRTVPPVVNETEPSEYRMPLPESYGPPVEAVEAPPREDTVAYGEYLAGPVGHCMDCHTPRQAGSPMLDASRLGAGGFPLAGPGGHVLAANITPHEKTGIGAWSDAEIKRAITDGVRPDGTELSPPMPFGYYARMTDEDLDAVVAYLRSLPPIEHAVR